MSTKKPRINKTKDQIAAEIVHQQKIEREKSLVKLMFPLIEGQKTIYDAQTVLQAVSGYIKSEIDIRINSFVVGELKVDLSKEKDSEIKTSMLNILDMISTEKAQDISNLLKRFGDTLAQFSANQYMKNPMSDISLKNIVAE